MTIKIIGLAESELQFLAERCSQKEKLQDQIQPFLENVVLFIPSPDDGKAPFQNWDNQLTAGWSNCKTAIASLIPEKSRLLVCVLGCDDSLQGAVWRATWKHFFVALGQEKLALQPKIQVAFLSDPPQEKIVEIVLDLIAFKSRNSEVGELLAI